MPLLKNGDSLRYRWLLSHLEAWRRVSIRFLLVGIPLLFLTACGSVQGAGESTDDRLNVVATTTFVGDTVEIIGGDLINLTVLLSPGTNPHTYQPAPRDMAAVAEAEVVFVNGLNLEEFLDDLVENANRDVRIVEVSKGIQGPEIKNQSDSEQEGVGGARADETIDPHVWFDPNNVIVWTHNIEAALNHLDAANAETYSANAEAYRAALKELDNWIRAQVDQIPPENKKMVTSHTVFGHFAERYGFEQIGAVIPAATTEAEPSGQQLAQLEDTIQASGVRAIFVSVDINPDLAERVAEDTHVQVVSLYFGSLTPPGGPAGNYLDFTRYNVNAIVEALK